MEDNQHGTPTGLQEQVTFSSTEQQVQNTYLQRRADSQRLIAEGKTLEEIVNNFDNDYSPLETLYREKVGCELITDPYTSSEHPIPITKSCSVVIPAYNSGDQLGHTLQAIQQSTFNARYPQQIEVVIVDDGSPKVQLAELVNSLNLTDLNVRVVRESNGRENKARYSGVLHAKGDIIIFTAQDVVYSPTMIEEYMKRHEVLEDITCFGFRPEIDTDDPRLHTDAMKGDSLWTLPPELHTDPRIKQDGMADCNWLKSKKHNEKLPIDVTSDVWYQWTTPSVAWGLTVSAPREALLKTVASYDERYRGYGGDDEHLVRDLIAEGFYVIPNVGGAAYHQRHASRYDPEEAETNRKVWQEYWNSPPRRQSSATPMKTDAQVQLELKNARTQPLEKNNTYEADGYKKGLELYRMGIYDQAKQEFDKAYSTHKTDFWYRHDRALVLTALCDNESVREACSILQQCTIEQPDNTWAHTSFAKALARAGRYREAQYHFQEALRLDPSNEEAQVILVKDADLQKSVDNYHDLGTLCMKRDKPRKALEYFEAALVISSEEKSPWSLFNKAVCLSNLGYHDDALSTLGRVEQLLPHNTWVLSRIGQIYAEKGDRDSAKKCFSKALSYDPENREALTYLDKLN